MRFRAMVRPRVVAKLTDVVRVCATHIIRSFLNVGPQLVTEKALWDHINVSDSLRHVRAWFKLVWICSRIRPLDVVYLNFLLLEDLLELPSLGLD